MCEEHTVYIYHGSSMENTLCTYIMAAVWRTHCVHISWQQYGEHTVYIYHGSCVENTLCTYTWQLCGEHTVCIYHGSCVENTLCTYIMAAV